MTRSIRVPTIRICFLLTLFFSSAELALAQDSSASTPADIAADAAEPVAEDQAQAAPQSIDELRRRLDILAAEVEKLRSGEPEAEELSDDRRRALGLAPSAAATYRRRGEGVSLAGYGEMLLENFAAESEAGAGNAPATRLDLLRAILYAGYRFNDKFLFNSELEFEHGGEEVGIEFAYLDYLLNANFSLRGGMLLLPLGLVNEFHEPTVFIGTHRPETERRILPSTWHENGAGILGTIGRVNFRAYVVNGLDATGFTSEGIRGGRQGGAEARATHVAFAGRLDVTPVPGVFAGASLYRGGSGQDQISAGGARYDIGTTIGDIHGQAQVRGFDFRALYARASIDDAGALSTALGLSAPVAEVMQGGYVQAGYNVLSQTGSTLSLLPFVRIEMIDTQDRVPAGFTRDLSRDATHKTLGIELKPIGSIVLKADYQWIGNAARTGRNRFSVNLGYAF
jgi:hypothetical protein